jgi:hypothetical protein
MNPLLFFTRGTVSLSSKARIRVKSQLPFTNLLSTTTTTMKFDTKKDLQTGAAVAMPECNNCYVKDNTAIPEKKYEHPFTPDHRDDKQGRQVFFEPTVVFTPILASQRLRDNDSITSKNNLCLLTPSGVDTLAERLNALFLGENATATSRNNCACVEKETNPKKRNDDAMNGWGRFEHSVRHPVTRRTVTVQRSYRLAGKH